MEIEHATRHVYRRIFCSCATTVLEIKLFYQIKKSIKKKIVNIINFKQHNVFSNSIFTPYRMQLKPWQVLRRIAFTKVVFIDTLRNNGSECIVPPQNSKPQNNTKGLKQQCNSQSASDSCRHKPGHLDPNAAKDLTSLLNDIRHIFVWNSPYSTF